MNMKSKRQLTHTAFKNATQYLNKGIKGDNKGTEFICWAIEDGTPAGNWMVSGVYYAKKVIQERIAPENTVEMWLKNVHRIPAKDLTCKNLQSYRHAWLQRLIREFSK